MKHRRLNGQHITETRRDPVAGVDVTLSVWLHHGAWRWSLWVDRERNRNSGRHTFRDADKAWQSARLAWADMRHEIADA